MIMLRTTSLSIEMMPKRCRDVRKTLRLNSPHVASWFDRDDIAGPGSIFESIGEFAARLGMDMKHWLAIVDLLAEPHVHANTGSLGLGRPGELCEPGELSVVDMDDTSCMRRHKRVDVGRGRGSTHSALRLADGLELRPGQTLGKRFERQSSPFTRCHFSADFERCTRKRRGAPPEVVRSTTGILKNSQDVESLEGRPDARPTGCEPSVWRQVAVRPKRAATAPMRSAR